MYLPELRTVPGVPLRPMRRAWSQAPAPTAWAVWAEEVAKIAARHSDPRTTARYDRARHNLDRHAVHTVAAFVAGAA